MTLQCSPSSQSSPRAPIEVRDRSECRVRKAAYKPPPRSRTVLIQSPYPSEDYLGMVSDRRLLSWFSSHAKQTPSLQQYLSNPLQSLSLPSLNLYTSVVACMSNATVLDAMRRMSEDGVSSIAVIDDETGNLLSAVSVTDIGKVLISFLWGRCVGFMVLLLSKIVVPSQSNHILSTPLYQFISHIKVRLCRFNGRMSLQNVPQRDPMVRRTAPTSTLVCSLRLTGIIRLLHPAVYSVLPSTSLSYTIEKLLASAPILFAMVAPSLNLLPCSERTQTHRHQGLSRIRIPSLIKQFPG